MGNTNGYNNGYGKGKTDGYNSGYTTGYNQGKADAGVHYKHFVLDCTSDMQYYTFDTVPDTVYVVHGSSGGGAVTSSGISYSYTNEYLFAGEGYWNGAFSIGRPSKTVGFKASGANRSFAIMFW